MMLENEETMWKQRSIIHWLRERDRNTRFFHVKASHRARRNKIDKFKDMHGQWHEE